nr:uncharacterized protein LOC111511625 [Leptinotarsa decemlineata]
MCITEGVRSYFTSSFGTISYSLPLTEVKDPKSFYLLNQIVLRVIEETERVTVLVKNLRTYTINVKRLHDKTKNYIIQIRGHGEFSTVIEKLEKHLSWNPHARFLVVSSTIFPNPDEIAAEITASLWKYNVVNVAILLPEPENTTKLNVYTWEPYSNSSCGDNFQDTRVTDSCSFGVMETNNSWFESKIKGELYNCTIKARYIKWPPFVTTDVSKGFQKPNSLLNQGIDVNLLNMVASTLNLIVLYESSNVSFWGEAFVNKSFTGDLSLLDRNDVDVDILLGGYTKSYARSVYFDCSRSYIQETLVWCVPHELVTLGLKPLIDILNGPVWIGVILLYIIFTLGIWYLSTTDLNQERSVYSRLGDTSLNNFLVLLGFCANTLPKSGLVRFLMGLLIIFSLHLNILYSSYLTSILSSHNFKEKYNSVELIYKYNLDTYFINSEGYFQSYGKEEDNLVGGVPISLILHKWKECTNLETCTENLLTSKKAALCIPNLHKQYLFNNVENLASRKSLIYCLNDHVVTFPIIMIMRKGFPLYDVFQSIMNRISSAGFIAKWEYDILRDKHKSHIDLDEGTIKFVNLLPIFNILLVGYIFSTVILIVEIIASRKKVVGLFNKK